jgi:hypothetical protein
MAALPILYPPSSYRLSPLFSFMMPFMLEVSLLATTLHNILHRAKKTLKTNPKAKLNSIYSFPKLVSTQNDSCSTHR